MFVWRIIRQKLMSRYSLNIDGDCSLYHYFVETIDHLFKNYDLVQSDRSNMDTNWPNPYQS